MNVEENVQPPLVAPLTRIVYRAEEIAAAVRNLSIELLAATPFGDELVLLIVLEGARRFGEDLFAIMGALPQAKGRVIRFETVKVSSYGMNAQSSGVVTIVEEPKSDLRGRHVVIVDDIVDQGHTIRTLLSYCRKAKPATVSTCVLFDKRDVRRNFRPDFVGLEVPPVFVVGYGLDYQENFRNLPYLATLDEASTIQKVASDVHASSGQRERA